jgi:Ca2+/H+ antiporter
VQRFNTIAATSNVSLLLLCVMALVFPSILTATHSNLDGHASETAFSRLVSVLLLVTYCMYVLE